MKNSQWHIHHEFSTKPFDRKTNPPHSSCQYSTPEPSRTKPTSHETRQSYRKSGCIGQWAAGKTGVFLGESKVGCVQKIQVHCKGRSPLSANLKRAHPETLDSPYRWFFEVRSFDDHDKQHTSYFAGVVETLLTTSWFSSQKKNED